MKTVTRGLLLTAVLVAVLACAVTAAQLGFGMVPKGWQKMTGITKNYSGQPDGIMADTPNGNGRENSYAWSMDVLGDYLYVGTSRNVLAPMLLALGINSASDWPEELPVPTDMRGRIFKMKLSTGEWSLAYLCDPVYVPNQPLMGADLGYRMMKTSCVGGGSPILYVGGLGNGLCRLLAIDTKGKVKTVFAASKPDKVISIRAITEHQGMLFWACEDSTGPQIWCSSNPLKDATTNNFTKISVPSEWFTKSCEIWDMVSFNGALYVFLTPYDEKQLGFWCAKLKKQGNTWKWELVVGDPKYGAKNRPGMGLATNGAGVPIVFKGKVYVGTMDATAIRMMNEMGASGPPPDINTVFSDITGMQIFRFDTKDKWERVVPAAMITNDEAVKLIGGFVNPLNRYIWRFGVQGDKLYAGTFDVRSMMDVLGPILKIPDYQWWNPGGFDMYYSPDGKAWIPETVDGFSDQWNYGARSFATDPKTGDMFMGTANPFYGCQIWRKKAGS